MDFGSLWRVWLPLIGGLWGLLSVFWLGPGPHGLARIVGLLLGLIGLGGVVLSRYTLGQSFSVAPKARQLVTRGIYSRIRNPIYIFAEVFLLGLSVILWRPEMLILLALLIPLQVFRARKEAAVLEERFGDSYRAYRKQTWF
jgi:protein-S-isoprenylcysteine O-methyltransferase Ste14